MRLCEQTDARTLFCKDQRTQVSVPPVSQHGTCPLIVAHWRVIYDRHPLTRVVRAKRIEAPSGHSG